MTIEEAYDLIARDWHRDHQNDDWWKEGTDLFISKLPKGACVLDVGCGSGVKAKYLAAHGLVVTGIDVSEKLLEIAKEESPTIDFRLLSMSELDSLMERFDAIFAQASLLHTPKKEAGDVVASMSRRLKPGGLLYVAVKKARPGKPDEEIKREEDYGYVYERFFSYFTLPELEHYFKNAEVEVVWKNAKPSGRTTWLQILGKK